MSVQEYFPYRYFPAAYYGAWSGSGGGDPVAAISGVTIFPQRKGAQITWSSVTENDTFVASQLGLKYPDRTIAVEGTFGSATVLVVGSWDGTNYHTLHGISGLLSFTAAGGDVIIENCPYIKLTHSGGSSESVTATLMAESY